MNDERSPSTESEICFKDTEQFAKMQLNATGMLLHFRKDIQLDPANEG